MKRKIHNIALMACIALLAASCSDTDAGITESTNLAVQFTPQLKGHLATRAVDTSWSAGDKVGIYMVADGEALPATGAELMQYQVSGAGESVGLLPTATDQTLYFPANGDDVNFIAFSPYAEPSSNKVTYSGFADQSTQAKMEAVDVLYSNDGDAFNRTNTSAALTFSHVMSKLVIKVTTDGAASEKIDLTKLTVGATGLPASASLNLSDGTLTAGSTKTAVQFLHSDDTDERIATAIVVPHSGVAGRSITLKLGSEDGSGAFSYPLSETDGFASGKMYVMEFVVTAQGVTLASSQSYDWAEGYIAWDDDYVLSVGETLKYVATRSSNNVIGLKTNNKRVSEPTVQYSTSATNAAAGKPSWVTASGTTSDKSLDAYHSFDISFDITGTPDADRFYAHITVGELKAVVEVRVLEQAVSANCIVLQTNGNRIAIPVRVANDAATYISNSTAGRDDGYVAPFATSDAISFDAKVLWVDGPNFSAINLRSYTATDIISEVSVIAYDLDHSYLVVKPGTKAGNAVVCITKPGTDEILWSWHIWVVNATDRATMWIDGSSENTTYTSKPTATANGYAFFPLHLGAFDSAGDDTAWNASYGWSGHPFAGLFYQWGRKDPITTHTQPSWIGTGLSSSTLPSFTGITGFVAENTADRTGMKSIAYPYYFNWSSNATRGWQGTIHLTGTDNNSWGYAGSTYGSKSPFDPCPAGWRVPPGYNADGGEGINAWTGASMDWSTTHANGIVGCSLANYGGFHPAAGLRYGSASFLSGDEQGYYWSAGPNTTTAGYLLNFYKDLLSGGKAANARYCGCSVRCVAESD